MRLIAVLALRADARGVRTDDEPRRPAPLASGPGTATSPAATSSPTSATPSSAAPRDETAR